MDVEMIYGYQTLRHEQQVAFIPPTRWQSFVCNCWAVVEALVQIALYWALIMSIAVVLRVATH